VNQKDARAFIAGAVGESGGTWADIGAGNGTFTRALLSLLAPGSRIYAIDRDQAAIEVLAKFGAEVVPIRADFSRELPLPDGVELDGIVLANALHFVPDAAAVLERLVMLVRSTGRVVIVEYDRRARSRWVPYPIASAEWPELAKEAGLVNPRITGRRQSEYAGELYVGVAERP
jgi:SAM-dependent methyltransferase